MPVKLISINNCGKDPGDMAVTLYCVPALADTPIIIPLPAEANVNESGLQVLVYPFQINAASYQATGNFGKGKTLQVSITRNKSWYVSPTSCYIAGRTWIYIPSSGQIMSFSPREILGVAVTAGQIFETENTVIPVDAAANSIINVYTESANVNGVMDVLGNASTNVTLTLFNFHLQASGSLQ